MSGKVKKRYQLFNNKRKIKKLTDVELQHCSELAEKVSYGGNPEHKMNPGDFGLTPPAAQGPENPYATLSKYFQEKLLWNISNPACVRDLSVSVLTESGLKIFGLSPKKASRWKLSLRIL